MSLFNTEANRINEKSARYLVVTDDGSHTIFHPESGQHYHSTHGALQESKHIYLEAGFNYLAEKFDYITIFEMGFGTGLNALLIANEAWNKKIRVVYSTCELYPLEEEIYSNLNYPQFIDPAQASVWLTKMHKVPWDEQAHRIHPYFSIIKHHRSIDEMVFKEETIRLIFFDAFAPSFQPQQWSEGIFRRIREALLPGSVLVTFATNGTVKNGLRKNGFDVSRLQGPKGKHEMLRALYY